MRRLAAALLTTTLLLAGCGQSSEEPETEPTETASTDGADGAAEATPEDLAALEAVEVEGDLGAAPTLTFEQPFAVSAPVAIVETEGTGAELAEGQSVTFHYVAYDGDNGETLGSTWETDQPLRMKLGDQQYYIPALTEAMAGQKVGTRFLFATPGGEATEEAEAFAAAVMAVEVIEAKDVPTRAEGTAVAPVEGLPTVTLGEDGAPSVEIPEGSTAPTDLTVQPLIEGTGPEVQQGQTISVQYHGVKYSDGEVFDSSWERGTPAEFAIGVGQVIQGWDQALVGQTVGSQLLLVIPPDLAYGGQPDHELAEETLVFVVDILDAY
ncbi:FKBP-type peptidyl-prolyl cis-trans isomerase [Actinotalea sp. AC32]|nr:FKBP-type peptidyl-prolyl cis-trans isomerase [Actinotalea sp. AC32]